MSSPQYPQNPGGFPPPQDSYPSSQGQNGFPPPGQYGPPPGQGAYPNQPPNNFPPPGQGQYGYPPPGPQQYGYPPNQQPYGYPAQPGYQQVPYGYPGGALSMSRPSFGQRLVAYIIDAIVLGLLSLVGFIIMTLGAASSINNGSLDCTTVNSGFGSTTSCSGSVGPLFYVGLLLTMVLTLGYYLYFVGKGQTLGDKVGGYRLVAADGSAPGIGKAIIRLIVQGIAGSFFAITYLWMLWDPDKQTLHDKAAGTIAVNVR